MRSNAAAKAPIFAALGDETRLALVGRLSSEGAQSIARLTDGAEVSRQAVSKHLRVLEDVGLVRCLRQGRESSWELQPRKLDEAKRYLDRIGHEWDQALARLKVFVED
ncbi:MAG TPA: metalloregulator ArsR/SmtB family transcription factor [Polyangiaceae bacterium]|jgi:DNA-binding transcriptional ArsR family regulator